jgi:hypothetical protein
MRRLQRAGHLHADVQHLVDGQQTHSANSFFERALPVVLHHQVRVTAVRLADLQHRGDVGMPRQSAHRALLTQETLAVFVDVGGEDFDRHGAFQPDLSAPVHDPETTVADLAGVVEPCRTQLRHDR